MTSVISIFKEKQLKQTWTFDAGALIWRILTSNNYIIGETRNQEKKLTSFFCIDICTGKPLWQNISFDEPWWIGIESVKKKWMILHGFVRPDMPEHRGIRIIDIETGKLLWRNDYLSFWFINDEKLYAHRYLFERHIGCELDIKTGTILNEYSDNFDVLQNLRQKISQEFQHDVIFPEVFDVNNTELTVRTTIQRMTESKALEGWVEYFSKSGILIVSQYRSEQIQSEPPLLNNVLIVYNLESKKTLYSKIIAKDVKVPSPDSFFIKNDFLFFIEHHKTLTALSPWK